MQVAAWDSVVSSTVWGDDSYTWGLSEDTWFGGFWSSCDWALQVWWLERPSAGLPWSWATSCWGRVSYSGVLISWLREAFRHCPEDANLETVRFFCRAWILHLFGCILFPDTTSDAASWMYIHCLTNWDQAGQYSWGSTVLSFLYRQLCEVCRCTSPTGSIGGCTFLLQLWMWSCLPVGRPLVLPRRPTVAYFWDQFSVPHERKPRAYIEYSNEMDSLTASSVRIWTLFVPLVYVTIFYLLY
jgi:hypothetical protein